MKRVQLDYRDEIYEIPYECNCGMHMITIEPLYSIFDRFAIDHRIYLEELYTLETIESDRIDRK